MSMSDVTSHQVLVIIIQYNPDMVKSLFWNLKLCKWWKKKKQKTKVFSPWHSRPSKIKQLSGFDVSRLIFPATVTGRNLNPSCVFHIHTQLKQLTAGTRWRPLFQGRRTHGQTEGPARWEPPPGRGGNALKLRDDSPVRRGEDGVNGSPRSHVCRLRREEARSRRGRLVRWHHRAKRESKAAPLVSSAERFTAHE